jgi:D-aspartate ligase
MTQKENIRSTSTATDTSTPAVILVAADHGPLGIARSLGRLGVSVYSIDSQFLTPCSFSRYCKRRFVWSLDQHDTSDNRSFLRQVSRTAGARPILIPTTDPAAVFVADNLAYLNKWFLLPEVGSTLARALSDKKEMYFLAKKHQIPTPETVFPRSKREVVEFLGRAVFPILLKGIDGVRLWRRTGRKMFIVSSKRELLETYDAAEDPESPNLMIQEYIPGGDDTVWMFNGYFDRKSDCLLGATGKKIRQCPIHTGATSLGISVENKEVEETSKVFMKSVGYRGILDIGYRYDARDGKFKVLDINPRIGASFRLFAASNGMDVARALYLDLTGQQVPSGTTVAGRKWLVEDTDLVSCYRYRREGNLRLKDWFHSLCDIRETAYFAQDDLVPLLPLCANRLVELVRRMWKRLLAEPQRIAQLAWPRKTQPPRIGDLAPRHQR